MKTLILLGALAMVPCVGYAQGSGDSDSDADGGFHNTVATSAAVMIRVPVDSAGKENAAAATMRLISGSRETPTDIAGTWEHGVDVSKQPIVNPATAAGDSDTHGWYGWNNWNSYGYNYNSYTPYYYYYNYYYPNYYSYYSYSYPYYYGNYGNYGYNYYYYPYYSSGYYGCY